MGHRLAQARLAQGLSKETNFLLRQVTGIPLIRTLGQQLSKLEACWRYWRTDRPRSRLAYEELHGVHLAVPRRQERTMIAAGNRCVGAEQGHGGLRIRRKTLVRIARLPSTSQSSGASWSQTTLLVPLPELGVVVIDLDCYRYLTTEKTQRWTLGIIESIDSYTEISPSGQGIRVIACGTKPGRRYMEGRIEIYDGWMAVGARSGKYLTVTRWHLEGIPQKFLHRPKAIDKLYGVTFD
jgi:hypothetical protein